MGVVGLALGLVGCGLDIALAWVKTWVGLGIG